MDVGVLIGEVAGFEFVEEFADLHLVDEQSGDDDEGDCSRPGRPLRDRSWGETAPPSMR